MRASHVRMRRRQRGGDGQCFVISDHHNASPTLALQKYECDTVAQNAEQTDAKSWINDWTYNLINMPLQELMDIIGETCKFTDAPTLKDFYQVYGVQLGVNNENATADGGKIKRRSRRQRGGGLRSMFIKLFGGKTNAVSAAPTTGFLPAAQSMGTGYQPTGYQPTGYQPTGYQPTFHQPVYNNWTNFNTLAKHIQTRIIPAEFPQGQDAQAEYAQVQAQWQPEAATLPGATPEPDPLMSTVQVMQTMQAPTFQAERRAQAQLRVQQHLATPTPARSALPTMEPLLTMTFDANLRLKTTATEGLPTDVVELITRNVVEQFISKVKTFKPYHDQTTNTYYEYTDADHEFVHEYLAHVQNVFSYAFATLRPGNFATPLKTEKWCILT